MKKFYLFLIPFLLSNAGAMAWEPGDDLIDERDGQTYKTVLIGSQIWMAENLNIGELIPSSKQGFEMADNDIIEKYCWGNEMANCDGDDGKMKRGGFYEWPEAMKYNTPIAGENMQGICPYGWHIPTNAEFQQLADFLGGNAGAGAKLKDVGESGFNALLTGYRCTMTGSFAPGYTFDENNYFTFFWTAEQYDEENAYFWEIQENSNHFSRPSFEAFSKSLGLCVRCIMDKAQEEKSPEINIDTEKIDFEKVKCGAMYKMDVEISNTGDASLEISSIIIEGDADGVFSLPYIAMPSVLEPGEKLKLAVFFSPIEKKNYNAVLKVLSNAKNADTLSIPISGIGENDNSVKTSNIDDDLISISISPNPMRETAILDYFISSPKTENIRIFISNLYAQNVMNLYKGLGGYGKHQIGFDTSGLPNGKYFLLIQSDNYTAREQILILR